MRMKTVVVVVVDVVDINSPNVETPRSRVEQSYHSFKVIQFKMMNIPPPYPHLMNSLFTQFKIMIQFICVKVYIKT